MLCRALQNPEPLRIQARLLYRTRGRRKYIVGVRPDQSYGADHQNQNHGQHDRILGNILALIFRPKTTYEFRHLSLQFDMYSPTRRKNRSGCTHNAAAWRACQMTGFRSIEDREQPLKTFRRPWRWGPNAGRVAGRSPEHTAIHGREIVPGRGSQ